MPNSKRKSIAAAINLLAKDIGSRLNVAQRRARLALRSLWHRSGSSDSLVALTQIRLEFCGISQSLCRLKRPLDYKMTVIARTVRALSATTQGQHRAPTPLSHRLVHLCASTGGCWAETALAARFNPHAKKNRYILWPFPLNSSNKRWLPVMYFRCCLSRRQKMCACGSNEIAIGPAFWADVGNPSKRERARLLRQVATLSGCLCTVTDHKGRPNLFIVRAN